MTSALDRPATRRQAGSLHAQFRRLGLDARSWRDARLAVAAVLAGRPGLLSVRQLTIGEAGQLLRQLDGCRDCRDAAAYLAWAALDARQEQDDTSLPLESSI